MALIKTTAIILKTNNFFEHDKRCECFSPNLGKITCLAKYVSKSKKKNWALEPLSIVNLTLFKGKSFYIINQYSVVEYYETIRESFNSLQLSLFFLIIIKHTIHEDQENIDLFNLLITSLKKLNKAKEIDEIKTDFFKNYLKIEGLQPKNIDLLSNKQLFQIITNYLGKNIQTPLQLDDSSDILVK